MARHVKKNEGTSGVKPAVIPIIQERATVKKRVIETGKVHIKKRLREYDELVDIPHIQEEVRVEYVPVNRFVDDAPKFGPRARRPSYRFSKNGMSSRSACS